MKTPVKIEGVRHKARLSDRQSPNPKDEYGLAKVPLDAIPPDTIVLMALGMKVGAEKYGIFNYRVAPVESRVYLGAAKRHLLALLDGEDFDPDTGVPHAAFIMATTAIFADAWMNSQLIDTRALPGRTGEMLRMFNESPSQPKKTKEEMKQAFMQLVYTPRDESNNIPLAYTNSPVKEVTKKAKKAKKVRKHK